MPAAVVIALSSLAALITLTPIAQAKVKAVNMNSSTIYFRELGELSCDENFGHLFAIVDGDAVVRQHNQVVDALDAVQLTSLKRSKGEGEESIINSTFLEIHSRLRASRERLTLLCLEIDCKEKFSLPQFAPKIWKEPKKVSLLDLMRQHRIHKRGIVDEALALASAGLSIYTLTEVKRLNRELIKEGNLVGHIASELKRESQQIFENSDQVQAIRMQVDTMVKFTSRSQFRMDRAAAIQYIEMFASNLESYSEGLEQMMIQKRATLAFFDLMHVNTALREIKRQAEKKGLRVLSNSPSEVLQQELSWISQEGRIAFFLHVGLVELNTKTLYELIPTPIRMAGSKWGRPRVEGELFAVDQDNDRFVTLSRATLATCKKQRGIYHCKTTVQLRDPKQSCIGAMFEGNSEFMAHYCSFDPWDIKGELMIQTDQRKVLSFVMPDHHVTAQVSCYVPDEEKMSATTPMLLKGVQEVELGLGCVLTSDRYRIVTAQKHEIGEAFVARPLNNFLATFSTKSFQSKGMKNVLPDKFNRISPNFPTWQSLNETDRTGQEWVVGAIIICLIIFAVAGGYVCRAQILRCLRNLHRLPWLRGPEPTRQSVSRANPDDTEERHQLHRGGVLQERDGISRLRSVSPPGSTTSEVREVWPPATLGADPLHCKPEPTSAMAVPDISGGRARNGIWDGNSLGNSSTISGFQIRPRSRATTSGASSPSSTKGVKGSGPPGGSGDVEAGEAQAGESRGQPFKILHLDIPSLIPTEQDPTPAGAILPQ